MKQLKQVVTGSNKTEYKFFISKVKKNKKKLYDFVNEFHKIYLFKEIYKKILLKPKVYNSLTFLLGSDLAHHEDPSLTINISNLGSNKKNYLFKKMASRTLVRSKYIYNCIMDTNFSTKRLRGSNRIYSRVSSLGTYSS